MQKIQLYIEGQRVDLFEDESVVLTQSIQNVKDIQKVFTDYSKTFTIPATKSNNAIFKHYYKNSITNGFDARKRVDANLYLNFLEFKEGKIKLEGVDLKNNVPYSYKVRFTGNTVTLKDLLGEDKLGALGSLSSYNLVYDSATVKTKLQADPSTNDVIAPLITHTQRLHYDSNSSANLDGNVYWESGGGSHLHGVSWNDLKYAIRVDTIIQAIATDYGITFSNDFFTSTNTPYYNLFMWMHRKKGGVPLDNPQTLISGYQVVSNDYGGIINSSTIRIPEEVAGDNQGFGLQWQTTSTSTYSVSLLKDGLSIYRKANIVGNSNISYTDLNDTLDAGDYTVIVESESTFTMDVMQFFIPHLVNSVEVYTRYEATNVSITGAVDFIITQQIPDIKCIDFLTGIFKMFNLTSYVDNATGNIIVKTLDDFYNDGVAYDVTEFIDRDKSSVNVALPFKEITFEHEDTKTFLAAKYSQLNNKTWGKTEYTNNGEKLDGSIYKVKTPFSQMLYERLTDLDTDTLTTVQYGQFVDDNQQPYYGKPLLFYPILQNSTSISFLDTDSSHLEVTQYNIPSNSVALSSATSKHNINFFNEINEYTITNDFTDTLFNAYHSDYISDVFDVTNRLTKLTAYLPLRILLNYTLADRFNIGGTTYKINSIKTNMLTGKSDLELLNDIYTIPPPPIPPDTTPPTDPFNLTATNITSTSFTLCWAASYDSGVGVKSYQISQDGSPNQRVSATPIQIIYCTTITGLSSGTTYVFGVNAADFNNNFSNTVTISVTTL
jgi:hypothetical protein